tara:strand:- start:1752 stop:2201 length:450 start_codon:yes stop_codon:yes gene_type:complete
MASISKKTLAAAKANIREKTPDVCEDERVNNTRARKKDMQNARAAARAMRPDRSFSRKVVTGPNSLKRRRPKTSFNYSEGSLVEVRKSFSNYNTQYISVDKGTIAMVVNGPYETGHSTYGVDILIGGMMVKNVNPKYLIMHMAPGRDHE